MTYHLDTLSPKSVLEGVQFKPAASFGNQFKELRYLIMHYTAGRGFVSTVERFKDPTTKTSAHLVVGRAGELVQMVPFDRPAWHAGPDSTWTEDPGAQAQALARGTTPADKQITRNGLNFYSLGIEFDNYGPITKVAKEFRTWFGLKVSPSVVAEVDPALPTSFHSRYWHAYSAQQIQIAEDLATFLVSQYNLKDILGHSDVCPGRKQDPGPLFPMKHIKALVFGRAG